MGTPAKVRILACLLHAPPSSFTIPPPPAGQAGPRGTVLSTVSIPNTSARPCSFSQNLVWDPEVAKESPSFHGRPSESSGLREAKPFPKGRHSSDPVRSPGPERLPRTCPRPLPTCHGSPTDPGPQALACLGPSPARGRCRRSRPPYTRPRAAPSLPAAPPHPRAGWRAERAAHCCTASRSSSRGFGSVPAGTPSRGRRSPAARNQPRSLALGPPKPHLSLRPACPEGRLRPRMPSSSRARPGSRGPSRSADAQARLRRRQTPPSDAGRIAQAPGPAPSRVTSGPAWGFPAVVVGPRCRPRAGAAPQLRERPGRGSTFSSCTDAQGRSRRGQVSPLALTAGDLEQDRSPLSSREDLVAELRGPPEPWRQRASPSRTSLLQNLVTIKSYVYIFFK